MMMVCGEWVKMGKDEEKRGQKGDPKKVVKMTKKWCFLCTSKMSHFWGYPKKVVKMTKNGVILSTLFWGYHQMGW